MTNIKTITARATRDRILPKITMNQDTTNPKIIRKVFLIYITGGPSIQIMAMIVMVGDTVMTVMVGDTTMIVMVGDTAMIVMVGDTAMAIIIKVSVTRLEYLI